MIYEFQATQDLHGWEKPWAPGANVNILDPETATTGRLIGTNGTPVTNSNYYLSDFVPVEAGTSYYFIGVDRAYNGIAGWWYDENKADIESFSISGGADHITNGAKTAPEGAAFVRINWYITTPNAGINYPDTETTFSPYANVCMPEGFNIWDPTNQEYVQVYAGYVNANTRELYLRPWYTEYAGEELVGPWMSSWDPYEEDTTPTEGAFVIDFGGELTSLEITPFMLQTLLDSLGIRQHFTNGAGLLNSLMDQAQGRVRSEEELLHLSRPLKVIAIGDQLPPGITIKPISKDVLPGLPGKFIR